MPLEIRSACRNQMKRESEKAKIQLKRTSVVYCIVVEFVRLVGRRDYMKNFRIAKPITAIIIIANIAAVIVALSIQNMVFIAMYIAAVIVVVLINLLLTAVVSEEENRQKNEWRCRNGKNYRRKKADD